MTSRPLPRVHPHTRRARDQVLLQVAVALGDLVVITAATALAALGRTHFEFFDSADVNSVALSIGGWIIAGWMLVNLVSGSYNRSLLGVGSLEYARVAASAGFTAGLIGIASYLTKFDLSRGFFVLLFAIGIPALMTWRWTARRLVHRAHLRGQLETRVLLAGNGPHIDEVHQVLARERWLGCNIIGAVVPEDQSPTETPGGVPVLGHTTSVAETALAAGADLVVFTAGAFAATADFRRTAWDLEGHHVQMYVVPSLSDISAGRISMRPVGGLPLVHVEQPHSLAASRGLKRAFDAVGALFALIVLSPVMLAAALAVRLEDGGPVLFRQTRVGRGGKTFSCLKFRSMVTDAEDQLAGVRHLNTNPDGMLFKIQRDPRITKVGRVIRRYSIDELPQLFNVLNGSMSLVGPRPALPAEVRQYSPDVQRRLHVRPGMTGLWQVSGRSDLSWDDTVRLDLYYVDNWSIVQDLTIMVRTAQAVAGSRGAY